MATTPAGQQHFLAISGRKSEPTKTLEAKHFRCKMLASHFSVSEVRGRGDLNYPLSNELITESLRFAIPNVVQQLSLQTKTCSQHTSSKGDSQTFKVAGVELKLVSSPGETNDQLFVWYADAKVLFAGDNFYRSFPNLYAIRGTPNRSVRLWADSLGKLADNDAVALVGGHTNPILGANDVKQVLNDYRDAVPFIHDKTVEGMNKGMTPDELVEYVQLPENLASKDYLQPYYGHPEWGVRSVFNGYLGWFDGNPSNLFRLSPKSEAERLAKLAGGQDKLLAAAKDAVAADDNQWAAQLADHLLAINKDNSEAKQLKVDALTNLARDMVNATARNYYLTVARELRDELKTDRADKTEKSR